MDRDSIERLAMDLAGGELSEDAAKLFNEYLTAHCEADSWAKEMLEIYRLSEQAVSEKSRSMQGHPVKPERNVNRLAFKNCLCVARWATVLVLAVTLGFAGGRWSTDNETIRIMVAAPTEKVVQPTRIKTLDDFKKKYEGTFLGDKIIASLEPKPYLDYSGGKCVGNSWPNIEQYLKERKND